MEKRLQVILTNKEPSNEHVLWLNTNDNLLYRYSADAWTPINKIKFPTAEIYDPNKEYEEYSLVQFEGSSYIALKYVPINKYPSNSYYWLLFAKKGEQGLQGNSGYQGNIDELEIVNNLTQGGETAALSAEQGKLLNEKKVDKEKGKQLSTEDFTTLLKNKLEGLNNYNDSELRSIISTIENRLNVLIDTSTSEAIDNFKEIVAFLENIEDSTTLESVLINIENQIAGVDNKFENLHSEVKELDNSKVDKVTGERLITEEEVEKFNDKAEKEGVYPNFVSGWSRNLTGRGDATERVFAYAPTGGDLSIGDDVARIKAIKGNTITWNQLFKSPKLDGTYTILGNTIDKGIVSGMRRIVSADGTALTIKIQDTTSAPTAIKGHKYYIAVTINTDGNAVSWVANGAFPEPQIVSTPSVKKRYNIISTAINSRLTVLQVRVYNATFMEATNQIFIDLTKMFGAGNEPSTVEEFRALFPNEYYEYNAGEFRSLSADGIKTTGFNQWDEEWELGVYSESLGTKEPTTNTICNVNRIQVLPNTVYNIKHPKAINLLAYIYFYDFDGNYLYRLAVNSGVFTIPSNCQYINFFMTAAYGNVYKNDICINISHTGYRNGEYEPYEEHTLRLGELSKYMPLRSAGAAYDEINKNAKVTRIGVVDLGELSWGISADGTLLYSTHWGVEINGKSGINVLCDKYEAYSYISAVTKDKTISLQVGYTQSGKTSVMVRDSAYTDPTAFKEAMKGVMLYYELAEPNEEVFAEAINLNYLANDFGTEEAIVAEDSAPFRADVIYQFNAQDRIRKNSDDINDLINRINILEAQQIMLTN